MTEGLFIPAERDFPPGRLLRRKEHLVSEVSASAEVGREGGRPRWLLGVLVPAAMLLLAATGVAAYVLTRDATQLDSIGCYDSLDLDANTTIVSADGRDPVAICGELWQQGAMGSRPAPAELAACLLPSGAVGVFPANGRNSCAAVGLAELGEGYAASAKQVATFRSAVVARMASDCLGESEARDVVRRQLDANGLGAWTIQAARDFSAARPCASLAFDSASGVVTLVPMEPVEIVCYREAELPSEFVLVRSSGADPISLCAGLWREGKLGAERPESVCLLHGATAGVFPAGAGICTRLGPEVSPFPQ
jgi:hypothetical protein